MASSDGQEPHAVELIERIRRAPYKFEFLQALRRLECLFATRPRLGTSKHPSQDAVRLAQEPTMRFETATLSGLETGATNGSVRLAITFFGLFGPHGPLPLHLTDYARDRLRNANDPTFVRFADIFHHRMICLLYRAWANAQPTVSYDRPEEDRFGEYVGSLFGIGNATLRGRDAMPDLAKLHFAGRLACQSRHREGLRAILMGFFKVPAEIEPFVGHWMQLPLECRWRMDSDASTGVLGASAVAGAAIWDRQNRFRILFGPLTYAEFRRFLPSGDSLRRLVAIVRNYCGDQLSWDVNLVLKQEAVPAMELGRTTQLGWNTWCASGPLGHDGNELCLEPEQHRAPGR